MFRLWCFLCGTIIQWPKHTQTQYADCSQFHRDIRWQHPRNDLYVINCIAWTTNCDNRWRLKWAHDAIRIWTAAPDYSTKPKWLEPAAQSLQHPGNDGSRSQATLRRPMMTPKMPTITIIGRNHLIRRNCPQYRRPQWTWAPSTARRRPTQRLTMIVFIQAMSPEEYIFFHHFLPRRRHRPGKWKEDWAWECPFHKMGECRSTSAKSAVRQSQQ